MPCGFPCLRCGDIALCSDAGECVAWDDPFDRSVTYGVGGGAMHVIRKLTLYVNGIKVETEWPALTVADILALVALDGLRIKLLRTGAEYTNPNYRILLCDGDEFMTPNVGHHGYDIGEFQRQRQAREQQDGRL